MKSLEGANDEIKNDYCQLAAEKETIERHYENLESKLKSMNSSKSSIQDSAESLKLLQVRGQLTFLKWDASSRRLFTASCGIQTNSPSRRRTPLYLINRYFRMNCPLQRRNYQK